jgi:hypothetical protein
VRWSFQSGSHIAITAVLQVLLQEEPLNLAAFVLLLLLDVVKRKLESVGGQPGLQPRELDQCRRRVSRKSCS